QGTGDIRPYDVIERLGGGNLISTSGRLKIYRLSDGRIVNIKKSKLHERSGDYWYGINPSSLDRMIQAGVTHIVFVMGDFGYATVPIGKVQEYLRTAGMTKNPDGTIRHYHLLITDDPELAMYTASDVPRVPIGNDFAALE